MFITKACPRCSGDLMAEELFGEVELVCIQCGHRTYPEAQVRRAETTANIARKAA